MIEKRLRSLRKEHGYTIKELAKLLSLSESVISLYENGKRQPSYDILIKLTKLYSVTADYLLGIDGNSAEETVTTKKEVIDQTIELILKPPFTLTSDDIKQIRNFVLFIKSQKNE
ncbi:helix-turn-helix domain-containing protein [Haloplasma contractile]|uniref:HTH-type transcriptional regulator ImmR protein n=1 Tax=Haloplasma contractile SSD-17B TaxID=1033810 RepID=U2FHJ1_9MOLU|nr:helix-turn-helix transcriptional regulator [Haloplasma contractile]ERJ12305.1 HTH-type transcriptional regulator ImmR protein [Haloplasma contractile SSD-17B]